MTRALRAAMVASGLIGLVTVGTAHAQISDPVEFTTSFPFTVGNTTVPAGRYEIRRAESNSDQMLELNGPKTHVSVFFETIGATPPESPAKASEVVFKKYGDRYVLKNIWEAGDSTGAQTIMTHGETHHAKNHGGTATEHRVAATSLKAKMKTPKTS